jgi:segregation and condensation protein A
MPVPSEYKVELDVFEGPLDLLLYLIKRDEVDIYNIPIERVTSQYMEYLNVMKMLDLNIAGEFLVMAATLMMIKSRMLLPVDERPELEEEEEDPRWELVKQLLEYKKFKEVASHLEKFEMLQEDVFIPGGETLVMDIEDSGVNLQDISLFDLISAFNDILKKAKVEAIGEIIDERFTVADKIEVILFTLSRSPQIRFTALFNAQANRHEIICTFLAVLELIRLRQVNIRQDQHFGEIIISGVDGATT